MLTLEEDAVELQEAGESVLCTCCISWVLHNPGDMPGSIFSPAREGGASTAWSSSDMGAVVEENKVNTRSL